MVLLMALTRLPAIASELIAGGMAPSRPVTVIENGTLPQQRTVTGTLRSVARLVERAGIASPAVVVVGETVGLRETISWFEAPEAAPRAS